MASRRQRPLLESGSPAPGFRLSNLEGGDATLAEWTARGRVLLVFFKVTCPVCRTPTQKVAPRTAGCTAPTLPASPEMKRAACRRSVPHTVCRPDYAGR